MCRNTVRMALSVPAATSRWTVPVLAALAVAALLVVVVGLDQARSAKTAADPGTRSWTSGVSAKAAKSLSRIHWHLTPVTSPAGNGDEGAAVDAASAQGGFLDPSKVQTVTLTMAADTAQASRGLPTAIPSPTWVVEFHNVVVPNLSGYGPDERGDMVALVDADTMEFLLVSSE